MKGILRYSVPFCQCFLTASLLAQTPSRLDVTVPEPTPYAVVERGPHSKTWERTVYELAPSGQVAARKHQFHELATGMHFLRNGKWTETSEQIQPLPGRLGAAATNGPYQVYFPADIYSGAIVVIAGDVTQRSRPVGISYFDGTNNVLIAELTNSIGQILPPGNQIIWTNCFSDFTCDLLATVRKSGLECDLIIRSRPPSPGGVATIWSADHLNVAGNTIAQAEWLLSTDQACTNVLVLKNDSGAASVWSIDDRGTGGGLLSSQILKNRLGCGVSVHLRAPSRDGPHYFVRQNSYTTTNGAGTGLYSEPAALQVHQ